MGDSAYTQADFLDDFRKWAAGPTASKVVFRRYADHRRWGAYEKCCLDAAREVERLFPGVKLVEEDRGDHTAYILCRIKRKAAQTL